MALLDTEAPANFRGRPCGQPGLSCDRKTHPGRAPRGHRTRGGLGQARSEWMRDVILRELRVVSNDPLLEEVVGIRLLLINVLRPLANGEQMATDAFDKLLEHVGTRKLEIVQKMVSAQRR